MASSPPMQQLSTTSSSKNDEIRETMLSNGEEKYDISSIEKRSDGRSATSYRDGSAPYYAASKRVCRSNENTKEVEMHSLEISNREDDGDRINEKMPNRSNKHFFSSSSFQHIEKDHEVKRPRKDLDSASSSLATSTIATEETSICCDEDSSVKKSKNESSKIRRTVSSTESVQNQNGIKRRIARKSKNSGPATNGTAVAAVGSSMRFQKEETIQTKILLPSININGDTDKKIQQQQEYLSLPLSTIFNTYLPFSTSFFPHPQSIMPSSLCDDHVVTQKIPIDAHLASMPSILQSAHELWSKRTCFLTNTQNKNDDTHKSKNETINGYTSSISNDRILNIIQGEVGHATPASCDVIVSDEATTCHIVAFWSRIRRKRNDDNCDSSYFPPPIATLTHVDEPGLYQDCLRDIIIHHLELHDEFLQKYNSFDEHDKGNHCTKETEEENKFHEQQHEPNHTIKDTIGNEEKNNPMIIDMDIHIMGGYNDKREKSIKMSTYLLGLFARLAEAFSSGTVGDTGERRNYKLFMTLRTCAVSQLNNERIVAINRSSDRPIGRGLGMKVSSGRVFLAKVDKSVAGPAVTLRSARIWSSCGGRRRTLSLIHDIERPGQDICNVKVKGDEEKTADGIITIAPFKFKPWGNMYHVLSLPDHEMIKVTSTSPDVEEDDFCDHVRETLGFIRDNDWRDIFGHNCNRPIVYKRNEGGNTWKLISSSEEYSTYSHEGSPSFGDLDKNCRSGNSDKPCCNLM